MTFNVKKTTEVIIENEVLEQERKFVHLGQIIALKNYENEIRRRIWLG